ncbi:secretion system protein [Mixta theicola]|uniref:Secretion system protein n=1 Tax=Mixta theicola TaxID=1458355 RepID=A0A2K1Q9Y7_9GAMM|nr:type II secretion system F family protein [Mixta theicola]PNS11846.1 secretion system protein [Mixta theicola]GLR07771.1 hypothetical protein GCM10007905_04900 [Mixta theicola]
MTAVFLIILLLGALISCLALRQQWRLKQRRKVIEPGNEIQRQKTQTLQDYHALIIANSQWLSFLQRLDDSLSMKLRICGAMGALILAVSTFGIFTVSVKGLAVSLLLVMVVVIILPALLIRMAMTGHIKKIMDALPYFIDLVAVCVQAGLTVENALKFVAERADNLDKNLASIMRHLIKRAEVSGLEESLLELYRAMDMTEIRMFCATLQQSVHYGTSLYDTLMELSKDIRELQLLEAEERIGKLSAKMSVPLIIFIMFPITILIAAPGILRVMKNAIF